MKQILTILFFLFSLSAFGQVYESQLRINPDESPDSTQVMTSRTTTNFAGRGKWVGLQVFGDLISPYISGALSSSVDSIYLSNDTLYIVYFDAPTLAVKTSGLNGIYSVANNNKQALVNTIQYPTSGGITFQTSGGLAKLAMNTFFNIPLIPTGQASEGYIMYGLASTGNRCLVSTIGSGQQWTFGSIGTAFNVVDKTHSGFQAFRIEPIGSGLTALGVPYLHIQGDGDLDLAGYKNGTRAYVADWKNIVSTDANGQLELTSKQQIIDTISAHVSSGGGGGFFTGSTATDNTTQDANEYEYLISNIGKFDMYGPNNSRLQLDANNKLFTAYSNGGDDQIWLDGTNHVFRTYIQDNSVYSQYASSFVFQNGYVGIGSTTPAEALDVTGNGLFSGTLSASNLSGTNTGDQDLSGYANTTLSNLGTTSINSSLTPSSSGAIDLGSSSKRWGSLYLGNGGLHTKDLTTHYMTLLAGDAYTADRVFSVKLHDANRVIDLSGDLTTTGTASISGTHTGTSSGTNTGDQDLSGYQPIDADLTDIGGLSKTGNSLKSIRVKADETGYELATVSSSTPGIDDVLAVEQSLTDDRLIDLNAKSLQIGSAVGILVDETNGVIGIGDYTNSSDRPFLYFPNSQLTYFESTAHDVKVGINTSTPSTALDIVGIQSLQTLNGGGTSNDSVMVWNATTKELHMRDQADFGGGTPYTDEQAQDAVGGMVNTSLTYTDGTPELKLTSRNINGVAYDGTANITVPLPSYLISPSQLTSDQDNYNPTAFGIASYVRLSSDNGMRAITSMVDSTGGAHEKTLINSGSYMIYLPMDHPDGTAANRFTGWKSDFYLYPGNSCKIYYDGTSSRWRIVNENNSYTNPSIYYSLSAASTTAGDVGDMAFQAINSGTITATASTTTLPGCLQMSTISSSSAGYGISFAKSVSTFSAFGSAHTFTEAVISIPTLSDGTDTYTIELQLSEVSFGTSLESNNTCAIRYSSGINSGKWEIFNQGSGGSESTADSGVSVAANTLYKLRIEVDKSRTEARAYINGAFVGRVTGNIPAASVCGARVVVIKSAGTTARTINIHSFNAGAIYPGI